MIMFLLFASLLFFSTKGAPASEKPYYVPHPTNGTCAYDGLAMGDPYDSMAYYQCCKNMWFFKTCLDGEVFDQNSLICIPTVSEIHRISNSTELKCNSGDRREFPLFDSMFEECVDGIQWEIKSCESESQFDFLTKKCSFSKL